MLQLRLDATIRYHNTLFIATPQGLIMLLGEKSLVEFFFHATSAGKRRLKMIEPH